MARRERFLLWGGGGHGKVVADLVRAAGYKVAGYADRELAKFGCEVEPGGARVAVAEQDLIAVLGRGDLPVGADAVVLAIGRNADRAIARQAAAYHLAPALVHPTAVVSGTARLEEGVVVFAHAVVNAAAVVDAAAIINTGAIVEHDCYVGLAAHIAPGAVLCGGVHVGARAWVGAGAVVIQGVRIGTDAVVGAGAVVVRDVLQGTTVVGNPARTLRKS